MTDTTLQTVWVTTLVIYTVVLLVIAALLTLILITARKIRLGVADVWTAGQRIANNTIQIALLDTTNHVAGQILSSAGGVVAATAGVKTHAEGCPGCPACVLGGGGWRP